MPLNYDAINALTRKKYLPKLIDNFFKSNPFLMILKEKEQTYDGGPKIVEPLIYGNLTGVKSYSGYDTITADQTIPITAAEFTPKNVVAPFIISDDEVRQNSGDNQVINLIESKFQILEETLKASITTMLYGDGTGNGGKDIDGLGIAMADTGTYGGIDRAQYGWWKAVVHANGGVARPLTTLLMTKLFMAVSDGNDKPTLILTDPRTWVAYHELLQGKVSLTTSLAQKMAGFGFQTLEFMGIPVVADPNCPVVGNKGKMYFINQKYLKWRPHKDANFKTTKMHRADNMLADKQEIILTGNITMNNMRRQGVLADIDVTLY